MNRKIYLIDDKLKYSYRIFKNYNLLQLFFNSYKNFLKFYIKEILENVFPIQIIKNKILIFLSDYNFTYPVKSHHYCICKGLTYSLSLKMEFSIYSFNFNSNFQLIKKFLKKEYLSIPNIPYMTKGATFIINGIEKTVISKLERSPGIYFLSEKKGENFIKIVPDAGGEIDFFIDKKKIIYIRRFKWKIPINYLLKSLGLNFKEMVYTFYNYMELIYSDSKWKIIFDEKLLLNYKIPFEINMPNYNLIIKKHTLIDNMLVLEVKKLNIKYLEINESSLDNNILYEDVYLNNCKLYPIGYKIDKKFLVSILKNKIRVFKILIYENDNQFSILNTFKLFDANYFNSLKTLNNFFKKIKFNFIKSNIIDNYNNYKIHFSLFPICRKKINSYYKININYSDKILLADVINLLKLLVSFKEGFIKTSDSLNLNNLSISMIGDILKDLFYKFFYKIKKSIEFKLLTFNKKKNLKFILNINEIIKEIKLFFTLSKYCQYLDKVNDISELSHKRKVTTISVIGISKNYSGFDCRDLNSTHYSRICPVETPEGIGIGLINSLSILSNVDNYRSLTAPYNKLLSNNKIYKKWVYLSVEEEFNSFVSEAVENYKINNFHSLSLAKYKDQLVLINSKLTRYVNIFPYQMLSISALLIPFIENNDSNRALMACNMIRQALPLIKTDQPVVYTGFEEIVANNSIQNLFSSNKCTLNYSDSRFLIVNNTLVLKDIYNVNYDIYFLIKYMPSNQKTNISQTLNSTLKFNLKKNEMLAKGSCTNNNFICLGNNLLTAILSWEGYNFEDSIIISERLVKEEIYTSLEFIQIDINVFKIMNKSENLTREIKLKSNNLKNKLNRFGIVKLGSVIRGGDILVGKTCSVIDEEVEINSNCRILNSIYGQNDFKNKDTSFYMPYKFNEGVIISSEVYFSDKNNLQNEDDLLLNYQINKYLKFKRKKFKIIKKKIKKLIKKFLINKKIFYNNSKLIINKIFLNKKKFKKLLNINIIDENHSIMFRKIKKKYIFFIKTFSFLKREIKNKYLKNLPLNIDKIIRLKIAIKNSIKVGDKMSGRYGNKGVVSKILPENQMPYLINGDIVDIVINPLGIPSRMNIGQLLELHAGFISFCLSLKIKDIFSTNNLNKLKKFINIIYLNKKKVKYFNYNDLLLFFKKKNFLFNVKPFKKVEFDKYIDKISNLIFKDNFLYDIEMCNKKGIAHVFDGRTGEKFENSINVGIMYFYKLNHLSEEKLHARSVGPYSMITQQPLKGKSNMGGQRLGEMEVWALEAYGAFYTLQEMLTIKSDDISGRFDSYRKIVKGIYDLNFNMPETFNVMIKNINSLMLHIRFNDY